MVQKKRKNIYTHKIDLKPLKIKNMPREEFRRALEEIDYRGYEVEQLSDGRKIVITKPGGKFTYGKIKREDFMVWVFNPSDSTLWLISHKDIYQDIEEKGEKAPQEAIKIIDALEEVFNGYEPSDILQKVKLETIMGESLEVLLYAYKWIWGQEDCNYPDGKGRAMSMDNLRKLREQLRLKFDDREE
jgi:hypothetical protein